MTSAEVKAANAIKRAIRFNRDRIFETIMHRHKATKAELIAYLCIYSYTDDRNACSATMGNDMWLMQVPSEKEITASTPNADEWLAWIQRINPIIRQGKLEKWTSKKIMRMIHQSSSREEIVLWSGWSKPSKPTKFAFPEKYRPRAAFLAATEA